MMGAGTVDSGSPQRRLSYPGGSDIDSRILKGREELESSWQGGRSCSRQRKHILGKKSLKIHSTVHTNGFEKPAFVHFL